MLRFSFDRFQVYVFRLLASALHLLLHGRRTTMPQCPRSVPGFLPQLAARRPRLHPLRRHMATASATAASWLLATPCHACPSALGHRLPELLVELCVARELAPLAGGAVPFSIPSPTSRTCPGKTKPRPCASALVHFYTISSLMIIPAKRPLAMHNKT